MNRETWSKEETGKGGQILLNVFMSCYLVEKKQS